MEYLRVLTTRENEVLLLLSTGKSNKEIANCLGITKHTVEQHLTSIYRKLNSLNFHHFGV